jgi:hypothetical protein
MMHLQSLTTALSLLAFICVLSTTVAFAPVGRTIFRETTGATLVTLSAKKLARPTFNKETEKWEPTRDDDGQYPYDAVGSLLRHGPAPFITRVTNAEEYEQGVLKYMVTAGVSRAEATGNMDAKLNNAMDWAYQKNAERQGARKVDYTMLKKKEAALVLVWAFAIIPLTISVIAKTVSQF